ncbi:hypothetical protein EVAR_53978_1 [Eumeta japonica]|uniref:Uncharacterized protein n=1 Tax=Eumeta variegata TaxID=151549 RepID=A0A4C1XZB0_EUMVA|nr:hypothetical protein EVAR_53978_1 [Eumeta japonica]
MKPGFVNTIRNLNRSSCNGKRRKAAEEIQGSKVGIKAYGDNFWDSEGTVVQKRRWELSRGVLFYRQCICPHGAGFEAGPEGHGLLGN